MITKEELRKYAGKLMFDMNDNEYETLQNEFETITRLMNLIGEIDGIDQVKPMTFPFELDNIELRNDEFIRTIEIEDALKNSDSIKDREIKVPKVVE